ncbi:MAG: hypothetical protein ACP6KW_11960 [Candidatus Thorarchaeota archaeon]
MPEKNDTGEIESQLRGNTLRVYWHLLSRNEAVGVREVQRAMGMSSPSVASHHLSKLVSLDLVHKLQDNSYDVAKVVKVGVLRNFIGFRGRFLPRYIFVAFFFTAYTVAYLALSTLTEIGLFDRFVAITVGIVAALFAWYESYRLWKIKLE